MKKKILALSLMLAMTIGAMAQAVVETKVNVSDVTVQAYEVSLQKDVKMIRSAMEQYLKDAGLKTKTSGSEVVVMNQVIREITESPISFYSRIEERGKKKNKQTVVTVYMFLTDQTVDQNAVNANLSRYLSNFVPYIDKYEAGQQMQVEQKNLQKAQKNQKAAVNAVSKVEKDIKSAEDKIVSKRKDIANYQNKIKDCENDIKKLESEISKLQDKKVQAEQKVEEADENVKGAESEVEKYRSLSE